MVKVHKRASKRVGTKQRTKIQKKVREHVRKSKRQAKKDPTWKSKKKVDPGIPNSYPYKEQLLNEIEQRRNAAELAKQEARDSWRNGSKDQEVEDEDDVEEEALGDLPGSSTSATAAAATARMFRGTLSDFRASLKKADDDISIVSVLLLLDARDPASWRMPTLEQEIRDSSSTLTIVLTKCDLVPLEVVAAWKTRISTSTSSAVFPICSAEPAKNGRKARAGGGIKSLVAYLEALSGTSRSKGKAKEETADEAIALIGIENSGRTALANLLAPALPRFLIFDTPPLVAASSRLANLGAEEEEESEDDDMDDAMLKSRDENAAHRILVRNSGSVFKVQEPLPLLDALMKRVAQVSDLMMAFNVPAFTDTHDFLVAVARTQGRLKKGAVPDTVAAARHVLRGWSTGEIGYYAKPPSDIAGAEAGRVLIEKDASLRPLVLTRKEWRQTWGGKEMRLTSGGDSMLGDVKVAFAMIAGDEGVDMEDEDEDEAENDDEDDDEELEEDEEDDVEDEE